MNSALIFHAKLTLKNTIKQAIRKPIKLLGIILAVSYFMFMPLFMKDMIVMMGLDNPNGYVLMSSILTLYFIAPVTLSYFKRNGINFKPADVNFMFATPIPPKQILFYGLMRQVYLQILMQIALVMMAVYIFNISLLSAILYGVISLTLNAMLDYSLAILMYGTERISDKNKKRIKIAVYAIILCATGFILFEIYKQGFSVDLIESLVKSPFILFIPVFGWRLGVLNFMFIGPNTVNTITVVLQIISAFTFLYLAIKMKSTGDYYEDGIKFTEKQAILLEKKGKATFNDMIGKKKKVNKYAASMSGTGAKVIFSKQWIEKRRSSRFILTFKDLLFLVVSIGAGFIFRNEVLESGTFFAAIAGITIYVAVFFSPGQRWLDEFSKYYVYIIPEKNFVKLWYATLIENINILIQVSLMTLPAAILLRISPIEVLLVLVVQVLIRTMLLYKSIFFDGYLGGKLGVNIAQVISLFITMLLIIGPAIMVGISLLIGILPSFIAISIYCILFIILFMIMSAKALSNMENIKESIQ